MNYYGRKVDIPQSVDQRALQHHWDINIPELLGPVVDTSLGDPSKGTFPPSDTQVTDTQAPDTQASDILKLFLASVPQACLSSPPPSELCSEGHKVWRFRDQIVDTARAAELWRQGHDVISIECDIEDTENKKQSLE
ncbi:hypothetical protein VM1G_11454 [Cytospora mali]|uniref:Uncharacterized protein n=1 Tax=Cytospora mali TaxID=578113 RepID=A0A194VT60_CYTMA|nr:hypothetical protein VM1G_11454 [Valsa mali]